MAQAPARAASDDTIIVTGRSPSDEPRVIAEARERLARTPGAVSVIANESYETRTTQSVADILRDVPGLLAHPRYGDEARLSIRGSGLGQPSQLRGVLLAQDGVPFADADGFSDFQKIDPLAARYVEVYRGGNALKLGAAQLGGAINFVTPTGRTAQSEHLVRVEGGSYDTARAGVQIARAFDRWDYFAAVSGLTSEGSRDYAAQDQVRGTLNIGRILGEDREIRLILYAADIDQQVPGALTLSQALATPTFVAPEIVAAGWARDQSVWRSSLQTSWRIGERSVFEGGVYVTSHDVFNPTSVYLEQQVVTRGAFGRVDWEGDFAGHAADLYWGFTYREGRNDQALGTAALASDHSRQEATELDLFAEGRWFMTERLALVVGGSYGRATRDYANTFSDSGDFDWLAPRVGLLWEGANGLQFYGNITKSAEPPQYSALVQQPFPGFTPVEPQEAWTLEIGARGRLSAIAWDVTIYRAELDGELLTFADAHGLQTGVANADATTHEGAEAALDWTISDDMLGGALNFRVTYTYADFHFEDDLTFGDNTLPVAPPQIGRAVLRYRRPDGWFVAPSIEWRPDDVYVDYANTTTAPGYTIWSLNAGRELDSGLTLFVDARNITDERYVPELAAVLDARQQDVDTAVFYPGEARSAYLGLSYRF